jgi:hypothetical protein
MKVKVSEAKNLVLDYLVAECEGIEVRQVEGVLVDPLGLQFSPSIDWSYGGMVIEREGIAIDCIRCNGNIDGWQAANMVADDENWDANVQYGPTPLIAAMRCYCCATLGDEIDIPEELCQQQSS